MRKTLIALGVTLSIPALADTTYAPHSCTQIQPDICLDNTPCKTVNGLTACLSGTSPLPAGAFTINATCWNTQAAFTCATGSVGNTCQPLLDQGCAQVDTKCLASDASGKCLTASYTMNCPATPAHTVQQTVCQASYCADNGPGCFDTSTPKDTDMGNAVAMTEMAREIGVYDVNGNAVNIFHGYYDECSIQTFGSAVLHSCCGTVAAAPLMSNHDLLSASLGKDSGSAGSRYVYDSLFGGADSAAFQKGLSAMNVGGTVSSGSMGAFGFQWTITVGNGYKFTSYDPTAFAAKIATYILNLYFGCTDDEKLLSAKTTANLCVVIGERCSKKVLSGLINVCTEMKRETCCFNSLLAKIINTQGRAQLGMTGLDRQCGGLTPTQLQAIDFSRIDFSQFTATIVPATPDLPGMTNQAKANLNQQIQSYYGQ
jgi:conjugal transfer mating pair stabilization protein TraN